MKKNLLIMLALFFCGISAVNAQLNEKPYNGIPSNVTVFAKEGDKFWLILNGEKQNEKPAANVKINGLTSSYYKVKVIFEDPKIPSVDANMQARDMDNNAVNVVYEVRKKAGKSTAMVMRVASFETIHPTAASSTNNTAPNQQPANNSGSNNSTATHNSGMPGQVSMSIKIPDMPGNGSVTSSVNSAATNTTSTIEKNTVTHAPPRPMAPSNHTPAATPAGCHKALSDAAFQTQLAAIKKQSFSDVKKKTAKTAISKNCLSTDQVKTILKDFSFEGDKLEMAKFAYPYTVDKENYLSVTDVFSFSSSTSELTDFLDKQ